MGPINNLEKIGKELRKISIFGSMNVEHNGSECAEILNVHPNSVMNSSEYLNDDTSVNLSHGDFVSRNMEEVNSKYLQHTKSNSMNRRILPVQTQKLKHRETKKKAIKQNKRH